MKYVLLVGLLMCGHAWADKHTACVSGNQIRVLVLDYAVDGQQLPCQVIYKKQLESEVLWSATGQAGFCEAKLAEFLHKQAEWGWRCKAMDMSVLDALR